MAAPTTGSTFHASAQARPIPATHLNSHRRICHKAGRALEILGHAIEYLSDEYFYNESSSPASKAHLEAVQLLMKFNREIYLACPEVPAFRDRLRSFLHLHLD